MPGLAPVIVIGGVKPNLVLVAVVLVSCWSGSCPGIVWAFAAGLTANLLIRNPLGSIPLEMLVVAALVPRARACSAACAGSTCRRRGRCARSWPTALDLMHLAAGGGGGAFAHLRLRIILAAAVLNAAIAGPAALPGPRPGAPPVRGGRTGVVSRWRT